ncbi:MAG: hypothetical protein LUI07_08370 [Lachnospiraceae bacterium]|nr:hypothetical protein [Lachnospiraceae bacterium]
MENRIVFRALLTEMKEVADQSNGFLTKPQIRDILKNIPLEENQFQLIYDYLAEQNIRVVESKEQATEMEAPFSTEERRSLSLYVDEVSALMEAPPRKSSAAGRVANERSASRLGNAMEAPPRKSSAAERAANERNASRLGDDSDADNEKEIRLIECAKNGDADARGKLIELYLPLICEMAEEYGEDALPSEDLIQEGNMGLLIAVESLREFESVAACSAHILNTIRDDGKGCEQRAGKYADE